MVQQERSVTELRFRVARLRVRLRLVRSRCWSADYSLNTSLDNSFNSNSLDMDSSPPLNTSTPMRRCLDLSDHSVNANEEFNSFFSSPSCSPSRSFSEEMLEPTTPKFEVTEDISSTHSEVKLAIYPLDNRSVTVPEEQKEIREEVFRTSFPKKDESTTLPLNVELFPSNPPPPPLPPRQNNRNTTPPKLPPKLKKRTRLFQDVVF